MNNLKKIVFAIIAALLIPTTAGAAIKVENKQPDFMVNLSGNIGDQVTSAQILGESLVIAATIDNPVNNFTTVNLSSYSFNGIKQWDLPINTEAISGPMSQDKIGNLYLLGATVSTSIITPTPTPTLGSNTINPDNIQTDPVTTPTNTLNNLIIWKISNSGQLLQTFQLPVGEAVSPKSITSSSTGLTIGASTSNRYFQVSLTNEGLFGPIKYVKQPKSLLLNQEFKSGTNKLRYFPATKSILGIPSWKPKKPAPVLVQYSKAGQIKAANNFQGTVLFIYFQPTIGVIVGSESVSGFGISIVKPLK